MKIVSSINVKKIWVPCVAILAACGITANSLDGDSLAKIKVVADPGVSVIGNGLGSNDIEFEQADVVIADIEFELAENCENENEDEGEINFEGPYVVDLLSEKSNPSLDEVRLVKGKYCKFKFKLDKLDDDEIPSGVDAEMIDRSVLIQGVFDGSTPFVVSLDSDEEFELEADNAAGFELVPDASNTLFLVFNLSKLFEGVDLSVQDQVGGTIYIDNDNNQEAYNIVKDNLKQFSKLFKDDDDDDEFDDDDDELASGN